MRWITLTAAAAAALILAAGAGADSGSGITQHDRSTIRFFQHHPRQAASPAGQRILWQLLGRVTATLRSIQSARVAAVSGSDMGAWLCIHNGEGSWTDAGAPFWGGLQMDYQFQATYGPEFLARWGTADHWPVWAQITAARRARDGYRGFGARGYSPWPNTARACGLL